MDELVENDVEMMCEDFDEGYLVFAPPETLTDEQRERADLHLSRCLACQIDVDVEYLYNRVFSENESRL